MNELLYVRFIPTLKQLSCQSWHRKRQVKYSEVFSPLLVLSSFSPSSRSFTSGLVLEWSRQPGQAAGRSMSQEAGTSCQALLLSCFFRHRCVCASSCLYSWLSNAVFWSKLPATSRTQRYAFLFKHLRTSLQSTFLQSLYSKLLTLRPSKFSSGGDGFRVLETCPVWFWAETPSTLTHVSRVFFIPFKQIPCTV